MFVAVVDCGRSSCVGFCRHTAASSLSSMVPQRVIGVRLAHCSSSASVDVLTVSRVRLAHRGIIVIVVVVEHLSVIGVGLADHVIIEHG